MKRYISDYHIGHANVLRFDARPFSSLDEMHDTIIDNWNRVVSPDDEVYILGDFAWNNDTGIEVLHQLKGRKYLIIGNHDRINAEISRQFIWVKDMETIKDGEKHVVLCHYPIAHWKNADKGYIHLYGHVHNGRDDEPFLQYTYQLKNQGFQHECYNVGCMKTYMNYTPRTLNEIISSSTQKGYK